MIYPAVKKYSEAKRYLVPMAIGAGTGVGLRAIAHQVKPTEASLEDRALGYAGAGIAGAGSGLMISGLSSGNSNDRRFHFGVPVAVGGTYLMGVSNNRMKEKVKTQSLSDAVYLPMIGGAASSAVGLYNTKFGSMKDMPNYNKRNYLLGSALVGAGSGLALSDAHPVLRGTGFLTGVTGMELARRAQFGPRVGEISNVAGDGSSSVAAVNGSGL
jgi:hypothetical protein